MDFETSILKLLQESFASIGADGSFREHYTRVYFNAMTHFVELEGDIPAGIMQMLRFEDSRGLRGGYFYGLFTLPQFRCRGIGRGLISDAIATLYCDSFDYVVLIPHSAESMRWYRKVGFETIADNHISVLGFDGTNLTTGKDNSLPAMYYALHDDFDQIPTDTVIKIPQQDCFDFEF